MAAEELCPFGADVWQGRAAKCHQCLTYTLGWAAGPLD